MPFDYAKFSAKCDNLTVDELHNQWNIYTRHISGGATSTAMSVSFALPTGGLSLLGLGLSTPRIQNARKKRAIIEAHLQALGTTHDTRKRDVIGSMALSGTIGGLTLGLAPPGAAEVSALGAEHAIGAIVANPHMVEAAAHLAVDGVGALGEEAFEKENERKKKKKALKKLRKIASAQDVQVQRVATPPPSYAVDEKKNDGIRVTAVEQDESDDNEEMSVEEMELLRTLIAGKRECSTRVDVVRSLL